ncbi:protein MULTIPOLAR SPINDLE 1 isoform X1 [Cannabis sativa]|uniref:protein MULTIPOLAR SPINDLE 1 isoform X1 n=1 Tax=Cannabis sativa TaxID=3483 RepID=UPI0011E011EA|nr:protein MULTIPOLAR SPINDLE 1 isoform X1 [Cannabis sativa]
MASESEVGDNTGRDDPKLRMALAISLLRSKFFPQNQPPNPSASDSDVLRWKRKAKERKQELLRLREDLRLAEDVSQCDLFPQSAACKCYFFDQLGKMSPKSVTDGSDRRFNDVLRRRFLRQVRFKERRRRRTSGGSPRKLLFSELNNENELEHLKAAIDFLVELCETVSPKEDVNFANWSHQAVDFILGTLKISLTTAKNIECLEGYISSLVTRLVKRMCAPENESSHSSMGSQFCVQHLIRKLGSESFIGQRAILSVSQTISVLAESLLFTDPFDAAFHRRHECMFIMIQLIEFLISDYLSMWSKNEDFDKMLFEEWVVSILHARKALELLENRNGLYVLYIDRVAGELSKQVSQVSLLQKLKPEILDKLLC